MKTDEDMFRALLLFNQSGQQHSQPRERRASLLRFEAPLSVTLIDNKDAQPVDLKIQHEAIFTTAVGHGSKRTLASWHVTTPQEIVEHMLDLVKQSTQIEANGIHNDGAKL